jgi:eukaryotic-like serine/threonine-protein kinase
VALIYSSAFFLADLFPSLVTGEIVPRFERLVNWLPTILSIVGGLAMAWLASSKRLDWESKVNLGLVFQVLASYGIACSMYLDLEPLRGASEIVFHVLSPSWVAVWMLFYATVVPTPPGRALVALLGSATAAPLLLGLGMRTLGISMHPVMFFFMHVFPYLICVAMAYVGNRVVFNLGADVSRARALGSYKLVERLGQGGMGEVWRASHQLLAREAAIKFIRPEAIAGTNVEEAGLLLKRFELEASATASLSSAHTIDLYDFGVTEDGTFYYVMELLDGMDCERFVARFGPQPPERVVFLLRQTCESLDEAHAKGLVHRDVKPANVYVCRSGRRCDFVKVLDFGLVANRTAQSATNLRLTMPEQAIGTPEFMSPEIALGQPVDGRADLYGLGCVAYWLLTGRSVFTGNSFYEVISKHMHVTPEPPSTHVPGLPRDLDALVLSCLEKSPEQRPATARELSRRLAAIPFAEPWSDDKAEAWWESNLAAQDAHRGERRTTTGPG